MNLRVIGAGLPRTGPGALKRAAEILFGGRGLHMSDLPNHPFDLGEGWRNALAGGVPDWDALLGGYVAAVDWPASQFWRELMDAAPGALVVLSVRDGVDVWWDDFGPSVLPYVRMSLAPGWSEGPDLLTLMRRFAGTDDWDHEALLKARYEEYNAEVRRTVPPDRLLEWELTEGWDPLCAKLGLPVPNVPFPWQEGPEKYG